MRTHTPYNQLLIKFAFLAIAAFYPLFAEEACRDPLLNPPDPFSLALSESVVATLQNQWDIQIAYEEVSKQQGVVQSAAGPFDPLLDMDGRKTWIKNIQEPAIKSKFDDRRGALAITLEKQSRIGTVFKVGSSVNQEFNPLNLLNVPPYYRINNFNFFFRIDQPLLRRFLNSPETIHEQVSMAQLEANKADFLNKIAEQVLTTVTTYWDLLATQQLLQERIDSQKRLNEISAATRKLILNGELAATEINQQLADIARVARDEKAAEQNVYSSFNRLLFAMGIERVAFVPNVPKLELEKFPPPLPLEATQEDLLQQGLAQRPDYLAAQWRAEASTIQIKSAENALLPDLTVSFEGDLINQEINHRAKSFLKAASSKLPERDFTAQIHFSYPIFNDQAEGEFRQREAEEAQAYLEESKLFENILTDVATAYRNHLALLQELKYAAEAVKWYQKALDDELKRLREGYSTLFFVLDFENKLSQALITQIETNRDYAQNIANLLFLTGNLVKEKKYGDGIAIADVRTLDSLRNGKEAAPCPN